MEIVNHRYEEIISVDNLLVCWREFRKNKANKLDVMAFERRLEDNIFSLHEELADRKYSHASYTTFHIYDPKHRIISKATVKDRLVHHVIFNELYQCFEPSFIYHSYASRLEKGTHLAVQNVTKALRKESRNNTRSVYVLKCDIKKFFDSVDHKKLEQIIQKKITDKKLLLLIHKVISSFNKRINNRQMLENGPGGGRINRPERVWIWGTDR